jgi:predicted DNA-binding mobile mystery protein A
MRHTALNQAKEASMDTVALARRNLDRRLAPLRGLDLARPPLGWLRAVRDALGMTSYQLAHRLGVNQSTVARLEQGEVRDTASLATLRQAAEALDCRLVYALVPNKPLEEIVRDRAEEVAGRAIGRVDQSMRIENQAVAQEDLAHERRRLAAELMSANPRRLWDEA